MNSCPSVKLADWKDRATAAQAAGKDFRLREFRAVVAASRTVILDEDGPRTGQVPPGVTRERRVTALRDEWLARITNAIKEGRIQQALEASIRPPEPGTRCPADLAVQLAAAAGEAMTADLPPEEWMKMLDAVVLSPVRRTVKPAGIPADEVARQAARHAAGSVPALAKLLGLRIPPPPPRRLGHRAPAQLSGRLSTSSRAVNPDSFEPLLREPVTGKRQCIDVAAPLCVHHATMDSISAVPTPTPARPFFDVTAFDAPTAHGGSVAVEGDGGGARPTTAWWNSPT